MEREFNSKKRQELMGNLPVINIGRKMNDTENIHLKGRRGKWCIVRREWKGVTIIRLQKLTAIQNKNESGWYWIDGQTGRWQETQDWGEAGEWGREHEYNGEEKERDREKVCTNERVTSSHDREEQSVLQSIQGTEWEESEMYKDEVEEEAK